MSQTKSEFAVSELAHLEVVPAETDIVMSFEETQSIRVAAWAVSKFGAKVLTDRLIDEYQQDPDLDEQGRKIGLEDLSNRRGVKLKYSLEEAEAVGHEIGHDLHGAVNRVGRGYPVGSVTVRGMLDTTAVIGSLERALETNVENFDDGEQYYQAAAGYMLDHMQVVNSEVSGTVSYLL